MKILDFLDKIQSLMDAIKIIMIGWAIISVMSFANNILNRMDDMSNDFKEMKTEVSNMRDYLKSDEFNEDIKGVKEGFDKANNVATDMKEKTKTFFGIGESDEKRN